MYEPSKSYDCDSEQEDDDGWSNADDAEQCPLARKEVELDPNKAFEAEREEVEDVVGALEKEMGTAKLEHALDDLDVRSGRNITHPGR